MRRDATGAGGVHVFDILQERQRAFLDLVLVEVVTLLVVVTTADDNEDENQRQHHQCARACANDNCQSRVLVVILIAVRVRAVAVGAVDWDVAHSTNVVEDEISSDCYLQYNIQNGCLALLL